MMKTGPAKTGPAGPLATAMVWLQHFCYWLQVGIPERDVCAEVLPSHKKEKVTSFQRGNVKVYTQNSHM